MDESNAEVAKKSTGRIQQLNNRQRLAARAALFLHLELTICALLVSPGWPERCVNLAVVSFGTGVGWILGTLISPYDKTEKSHFSEYAKVTSVFLSGFVAAKLDAPIEHFLSVESYHTAEAGFRIIGWFAAIFVTAMYIFCVRSYEECKPDGVDASP